MEDTAATLIWLHIVKSTVRKSRQLRVNAITPASDMLEWLALNSCSNGQPATIADIPSCVMLLMKDILRDYNP